MTQKMSPFIRNVQTVAAILIHASGEDFIPFNVVASNAEAEIRAKTFGGNDLAPEEIIEGVVMSITSELIYAGILECNTFDKAKHEITYRHDTAVRLSNSFSECLDLAASTSGGLRPTLQ